MMTCDVTLVVPLLFDSTKFIDNDNIASCNIKLGRLNPHDTIE